MDNLKSIQRDKSIDIARAIGIILVVFGHSFSKESFVLIFVFAMHMPLFFITAGMLNKKSQINSVRDYFIKMYKKARALLVPYIIWQSVLGLMRVFLSYKINGDFLSSILDQFYCIIQLTGSALWFLPALFFCYLVFYLLYKYLYLAISVSIVLFSLCVFLPKQNILLESFLRWIPGLVFMFIGYYCSDFFSKHFWFPIVLGILLLFFAFSFINGQVDMSKRLYGNVFLYIINGCMGTGLLLYLSRYLSKKNNYIIKKLIVIGENTIVVLCLHPIIIEIIRLLDYKTIGIISALSGSIEAVVLSIIVLLIVLVFLPVCKKYLWWSFGIRKKIKED